MRDFDRTPTALAFGVFWGRDAPSVADLLYHDEGTTSSVLRTVRTSDIVPRLAASAASWRRVERRFPHCLDGAAHPIAARGAA